MKKSVRSHEKKKLYKKKKGDFLQSKSCLFGEEGRIIVSGHNNENGRLRVPGTVGQLFLFVGGRRGGGGGGVRIGRGMQVGAREDEQCNGNETQNDG